MIKKQDKFGIGVIATIVLLLAGGMLLMSGKVCSAPALPTAEVKQYTYCAGLYDYFAAIDMAKKDPTIGTQPKHIIQERFFTNPFVIEGNRYQVAGEVKASDEERKSVPLWRGQAMTDITRLHKRLADAESTTEQQGEFISYLYDASDLCESLEPQVEMILTIEAATQEHIEQDETNR